MKTTLTTLQKKKGKEKIAVITAYDALFASIFDGEVDMILVGDSLSMSFGGHKDTIPLSFDDMLYHTKAVRRGVKESFLIADMPFGSYNTTDEALKNATRLYKEGGADAIKIEVGESKIEMVEKLVDNGIAVMPHIGLKPQFYRFEGGYKIKGKSQNEAEEMLSLALELEKSGAFGFLIEGTKKEVAENLTNKLSAFTIGIGSGVGCDGQVLVWSDAFGFFDEFTPKFVRKYLNGKELLKDAIRAYARDIKEGKFPNDNESY
ncbi:3-methyl-2-oxobutanoate hydroxymethyltransferase [Helicobacter sp. 16-1353]|uniref:3-methyl-2-oxobutanoate hydroxymethyltransferase n=1 Tax=Helicobacter sp. 16-1353 TaxID=2004996 RepID=UPI000DCF2FFC|nr:3-methyl-2-oxobutanoate hydroxymethyltransferase [Helicobacter sp. 16-1353]RAX55195.1 3-methyl-2-oxobutanoate hydroxymethyltransferase [Helicobacter sp. 16-1353]